MSNFPEIIQSILTNLEKIWFFLLSLWWLYIPLILFFFVRDLWIKNIRQKFVDKMKWVLLEIKPPRDIEKTPRAMEQFFAGLHGCQRVPTWKEKNIYGQVQNWFSMEMISQGGQVRFLVRTLAVFQNMVEAQIYAQYPESEITLADDYVFSVPDDIPNDDYDLWGTELMLAKEDVYPIRTFPVWEKDILMKEQRLDPLASLLEVMSKMGQGEQVWIQTLIRPVGDSWKKAGEELRDELMGREKPKKVGEFKKEAVAWKDATREVVHQMMAGSTLESGKEEKSEVKAPSLTKGEQEVVNAIEQNISKIGFETIIRFLYLARKDVMNKANVATILGCFKQFNTQNLNGFRPNGKVTTKIDYQIQLKGPREVFRKRKILTDYKKRDFVLQSKAISYLKPLLFERLPILKWFFIRSQPFIFNIEELATIYHFPGLMVKAPLMPKVEAKKGEPPVGLPMGM